MSGVHPHRRRGAAPPPADALRRPDWLERLRTAESARSIGTLGRFTILGEAGRGGQGTVYRARDPETGATVAIKKLHPAKGSHLQALRRLENEIRAAGALSHPNVVRTLGAEAHGADLLLVMEWVDGVALQEWAWPDGRRRPVPELMSVFRRIAAVMAHAHERGVLHRDFKPANVLVDEAGEPRLLDFGLAKLDVDTRTTTIASTGFLGTLAYAPPELVARGPAALDARSDLYSLGVTLYEMLVGRPPYDLGGSISTAVEAILHAAPAPIADPSVPPGVGAIVARLLAKRPEDRYATAAELVADLECESRGLPLAVVRPSPRAVPRSDRWRRRAVAGVLAALVIATSLVATDTVVPPRSPVTESAGRLRDFLASSRLTADAPPEWSALDVRSLVDGASARAAAQLAADPLTEAGARVVLALHYAELGLWRDVEAQGARAMSVLEGARQTRGRTYAAALAHTGFARARNGDASAAPLLRRALALEDARPDPSARITEQARQGLVLLARSEDPVADAATTRRNYEEAVAWLEAGGDAEPAWLASLSAYLRNRIQQGRTAEAIRALTRANDLVRRLPDAPATTRAILWEVNGEAYTQLERWDDAESAYREALSTRRGRLDGRVPPALSNLATTLLRQGRPAAAIDIYHRAVIARCELLAAGAPAARPAFEAMAEHIRRDGLGPADVRALDGLFRRHAPDVAPRFLHTARRIAETHAQLGHRATSEAIREAIRSLETEPEAVPVTARADVRAPVRG